MKETKFRVWLDYCNKFEYPDSITFYSSGQVETSANRGGVVQQYTGIKDLSGNEIYEGDIIENVNFIGEVIFQRGSFYLKEIISKKTTDHRIVGAIYWDKIIGNIFELPCNPDHNCECLVCDCWLNECPFKEIT